MKRPEPTDAAISPYLVEAARQGVTLVGLASGAAALAEAGLMRARRCCVHWADYKDFVRAFDDLRLVGDQLFLIDGNRITCAGATAAGDLAVSLVERHCGRGRAQASLNLMLVDRARPAHAAQPHPAVTSGVKHERVRRAIVLMEQALAEPYSVEQIARRVNLSRRQLERLFHHEVGLSVQGFSRRLRVRYGLWRLLHSEQSITDIAQQCGFADSSHFCRKFSEQFGRTPSEVRMKPDLGRALYEEMDLIPGRTSTPRRASAA
jgi:transcriptional regulator GlxA family with amidase domain